MRLQFLADILAFVVIHWVKLILAGALVILAVGGRPRQLLQDASPAALRENARLSWYAAGLSLPVALLLDLLGFPAFGQDFVLFGLFFIGLAIYFSWVASRPGSG